MSALFDSLWSGHRFALIVSLYVLGAVAIANMSAEFASAALAAGIVVACITNARFKKLLIPLLVAFAIGQGAAALATWRAEHKPYAALGWTSRCGRGNRARATHVCANAYAKVARTSLHKESFGAPRGAPTASGRGFEA